MINGIAMAKKTSGDLGERRTSLAKMSQARFGFTALPPFA
jgi:hypothetical protein